MRTQTDILMLPVEGDLDVSTVPALRAMLERHVARGCRRVILNLANVSYVDSMGMGLILTLARRMRDRQGLLSLVNVCPQVYRMLCICRLVDFIPVSGAGPKPPIPALDPTVRPIWHATMRVDARHMDVVRKKVERMLRHTGLTPDEAFDLTLACGEALGNAVDHTCAQGVLLGGSVYPDRVVLEVTDCGEGFELAADEEPPEGTNVRDLERGRGIRLMRLLADSVEIARKPSGEGTVVRLVKLLAPGSAPRETSAAPVGERV